MELLWRCWMNRRLPAASLVAFPLAAACVLGTGARAQEQHSPNLLTTDHYMDLERVNDAQISPDGARVIYTRQHVNTLEDKWDSELWIVNADGSQNRFFVKGSGARWSPDGKRVLYMADGEPKGSQIFVRWVDIDGPPTPITHAIETPRGPRWSPDGKTIAFSMFVPEKSALKIDMPAEPKGAKWTPAPRYVQKLHYRQDQIGFLDDGYMHLFVVPADGGSPRALTSGAWSVGGGNELRGSATIEWTPDSRSLVFEGLRDPDAERKYQTTQIYAVDVASGTIRDVVSAPGAWGRPAVSPDGRQLTFTGYPASPKTHTVADLFVMPLAGGAMKKISGDLDRDPINPRWAPDGSGVYFDAQDRGSQNIYLASMAADKQS